MSTIIIRDSQTRKVWGPFDKAVTLGRDSACDVPLACRVVSKSHCRLEPAGTGWALVDLGSTNGTFIGSDRVSRARLADGDTIAIGDVKLDLHIASPSPRSPVAPAAADRAVPAAGQSLWEQATAMPVDPAASHTSDGSPAARARGGWSSQRALVAALVGFILLCIAWGAYSFHGKSPAAPGSPRQLAPIDSDPSV